MDVTRQTVGQGRPISLTAVFCLAEQCSSCPVKSKSLYPLNLKKPPLGGFFKSVDQEPCSK